MARLLVLALVLGSITSGHARRKKQTPDAMLLEAMDCGKRSCDTLIDAAIDAGADVNKRRGGRADPADGLGAGRQHEQPEGAAQARP